MIQVNCKVFNCGLNILDINYGDFDSVYDAAVDILKKIRHFAVMNDSESTDTDLNGALTSMFYMFHKNTFSMTDMHRYGCDFLGIGYKSHEKYDTKDLFGETEDEFIHDYDNIGRLAYNKIVSIIDYKESCTDEYNYDEFEDDTIVWNGIAFKIVATEQHNHVISDINRYICADQHEC